MDLQLPTSCTVSDIRQAVSSETGWPPEDVLLGVCGQLIKTRQPGNVTLLSLVPGQVRDVRELGMYAQQVPSFD